MEQETTKIKEKSLEEKLEVSTTIPKKRKDKKKKSISRKIKIFRRYLRIKFYPLRRFSNKLNITIWKDSIKTSLPKIFYSVIGNLFPILFGSILLFFLKPDFNINELLTGQNLLIFSATFTVSSLYLWKKNSEKNQGHFMLLVYFLLGSVISIFFAISYLPLMANKDWFESIVWKVFFFAVLLYCFFEIYENYLALSNQNIQKTRKHDQENLLDEFDKLGNINE